MTELADLVFGKIFDGDELIVEIDEESMRTIRNELGKESGQWYNIKSFMYDLTINDAGKPVAKINGHCEIFSDDEMHPLYLKQLKDAGMWREE